MSPSLPEVVARAAARAGPGLAFGVPGGGANLDVVGALGDRDVRFVLCHGETAAAIMAATTGHLSGRPGLAVATRGPGAAASVNGVAQATLDRMPMVLVTDAVPQRDRARVRHQRLDQVAMLSTVTKWSGVLGATSAGATAAGAFAVAAAAPPGGVHLDIDASAPGDVVPLSGDDARPSAALIDAARSLLRRSRRPVVLAGTGALPAATAVRAALERLGAPVLTSYQAVGLLPSGHRLDAGLFTNGASERAMVERADLVVLAGLDGMEPIPAPWTGSAPVLSLSPWRLADAYAPVTVELCGAVDVLLDEIDEDGAAWDWPDGAAPRHRGSVLARLRGDGQQAVVGSGSAGTAALDPVTIVETVAAAAPPGTTATVDAGAHFLAVMPFWPAGEPGDLLISNGLATMGFAVPAAIGAALARPGRPVVAFVGDGGLGMTLAELETVARLDLPVTVVVFDDARLSLIAVKQGPRHGGPGAVGYGPVDFAAIATAMGVEGVAVSTADELTSALCRGWDRPRLLDVRTDPAPYRHLIAVTRG